VVRAPVYRDAGSRRLRGIATQTRAAVDVEHGQQLTIEQIELPDPNPDEVLVELYASGICYSQLHQMHNPDLPRPLLLGYEATGVVAATGGRPHARA